MTDQEDSYETLIERAEPANEIDLDGLLSELELVQGEKGRWNDTGDLGKLYKELRDKATAALDMGPRYFIAADGSKVVAVRQQAQPVVIDLDKLAPLIDEELLDKVAPRKVNADAFRKAVAAGRISDAVFVQVAELKPSAPHVRFVRADAGE